MEQKKIKHKSWEQELEKWHKWREEHPNTGKFKVVLYARVSKDEHFTDNRFQDPENQLIALREYCKIKDWEIVGEYVDKWSGADPNRPSFKQMFLDNYKGFKAIVVWKWDRFSREPLFVSLSYIERLRMMGIGLISITEDWLDTRIDNPMSTLVTAIMAWASSEERRKISERTKVGIQRRKNLGVYKGGRPRKERGGGLSPLVEDD